MIEYELVRSKRKTLAVQVTREGRVIIRAPLRLSKTCIEQFITEHEDWIARALADRMPKSRPNSSAARKRNCRPRCAITRISWDCTRPD